MIPRQLTLIDFMSPTELIEANQRSLWRGDALEGWDEQTKPTALDFFAGSGLATVGLRDKFDVLWANDNSPQKAKVYVANHGPHLQLASIVDVSGVDLPPADLSWASFPCQDLSLAGNIGGIDSGRSGLVWQWLRIVDEMDRKPSVLVAENVLGLVSSNGGRDYARLHNSLTSRGYRVGAVLLDAIHWLPQSRPRIFVVAVNDRLDTRSLELPAPALWCHPPAIQQAAAQCPEFAWWRVPKPPIRACVLDDILDETCAPDPPARRDHILGLIAPAHWSRVHATSEDACYPGYRRIRHGKQVLELRFDRVAGCLRTPAGGSSRQVIVTKKDGILETRLISVREAARLMGAPESYDIPGSYNDGYKAMGDAVAVPVVRHLAQYLLRPAVNLAREASTVARQ